MISLPEQFNAARKAQFETGLDVFQSFANQAFESASRFAALNLSTSRDAMERSARTATALLASRDPRDLLMLGGHAEEQVRSLFSYGRELMNIAGGVRPYAVRPALAGSNIETVAFKAVPPAPAVQAAAPAAPEAAPPAPAPVQVAAAAEPVVVAEPEPAVELLVTAVEPAPVPVAEAKAIVKAVGKGNARAAVAQHPAAAPVEVADAAELPKVEVAPPSPRRKK